MSLELNYSNLQGQESMLLDSVRCRAFRRAIAETVKPGDVVLDIGAGTGILSMFAAQAGARVVYAAEQTLIAQVARRIIAENGFADRINVFQGDMATVELPEQVDVIVSEWLGGYGVDENLLPVVVHARDRWLKPGGKIIPGAVTAWMAPAFDDVLQQDVDFWRSDPYGVNLDLIGQAATRRMYCCCNQVKEHHILCEPQLMWAIDGLTCSADIANQRFACELEFTATRDGEFNALAAWFSADLSSDVVLCNGPAEPDTHWGRHVFPAGKIVSVKEGAAVSVKFGHDPVGKGESRTSWEIEVGDYRFESEGVTLLIEQTADGEGGEN